MRLFDIFDRTSKSEVDAMEKNREKKPQGGKFFKIVNTICIIGIFIALGLGVLAVVRLLDFTPATFGIVGTIASICIGCWIMLPWVAYLEQKMHKKLSLVFIGLDITVPVLWIFAIWFLVIKVKSGNVGPGTLSFIQAVIIISLQFAVVSIIANTILKYGRKLLIVQIIAYISYAFFDIYVSWALCCISFSETKGIVISGAIDVLGNRVMLALFVLSLVYITVAFSIINGRQKRRRTLGDRASEIVASPETSEEPVVVVNQTQSTEEQLQSLQSMLDKGLITRDEYEQKRKEIIGRM